MAVPFGLETDIDSLAHRLSESFGLSLEQAIKRELMKKADVIVSDVAREMARSLRGKVRSYREAAGGVQIVLVLDGVKELVPPHEPPNA